VLNYLHVLGFLALSLSTWGVHACEAAVFQKNEAFYRDQVPELSWLPVAQATSYLVEMVARVPEGAVVERRTFRTEKTFTELPKRDTSRPTKISLTITAECAEQSAVPATESVVVAPPMGCSALSGLAVKLAESTRLATWANLPGQDYEVRVFDAVSGVLTLSLQTQSSSGVPIPGREPSVVAVRPLCGATVGPASYFFAS
jgi:hypothetical protein